MPKKALCLIFVFLFIINSFAAVVSDNDGAAFVTKAEFEALKKSFANQVEDYNTSIDSKIDGAIASYLDGIKLQKKSIGTFDSATHYKFPLVMIGSNIDWTTPSDSNDYYMLARPRVRIPIITNIGMTFNAQGSYVYQSLINWNSTSDNAILTVPPGTMGNNVLYGWLERKSWDMPGKSSFLFQISNSSDVRVVGSSNYKIFDIKNSGVGYQYFDYQPVIGCGVQGNSGHFGENNSNAYVYFALIGTTYIGTYVDEIKRNPGNSPTNWTESDFKTAGSGYNNLTIYNQRGSSYLGTKVKVQDIAEWHWHGGAGFECVNKTIDSANFVWSESGYKSFVFAGTANAPAEVQGKFGLAPVWTDGLNTYVEAIDIEPTGWSLGFAYNVGTVAKNSGHFLARSVAYCPPLKPITYNGTNETIPSFSSLPASCIRYYDSLGKVHYMDEGFFVRNFENDASFDMDLLFKGKSGAVKNMNLYVSKKPFSRDFSTTDYEIFSWTQGTNSGEGTTASIRTGTKVSIHFDNILKGDQVYLFWAPANSGDYIELSEVQNFIVTE